MEEYKGIGVSFGITIGKVMLADQKEIKVERIKVDNPEEELQRFEEALRVTKGQIEEIKNIATEKMGSEHGSIFEAHLLMLQDTEMYSAVKDKLKSESINAEAAVFEVRNTFVEMLQVIEDEYIKERVADIRDVTDRLLRNLLGQPLIDLSRLSESVILVTRDLTPSDTATMDKQKVLGFVTDMGGRTSHTAIMARTLEIPAVVGLKDITKTVNNGDIIIIDGEEGRIYINPDQETILLFQKKRADALRKMEELKILLNAKSVTLDGKYVEIAANIGTPDDVAAVLKNGAEGIGLYRTEFLYMNSKVLPSEEDQFEAYRKVVEDMGERPVIIRTLDIGGDKELQSMDLPKEMNPFLGYRAIRICLDNKQLFMVQLRALLRASAFGNLRIMLPMISDVYQVREAKKLIEEAKSELSQQGYAFDKNIQVGIMIEIPAAAMISDLLAKEADFFSIGTNDLIQYSIAVDRMNEKITKLYNPLHPGVLRLIKMTIENGHKQGIQVGMCGEMAGDLKFVPLLLGLGLDELSMSASMVLPARKLIRELEFDKMKEIASQVLTLASEQEIEQCLKENNMLRN